MQKATVDQAYKKIQSGVIHSLYFLSGREKFFHDQITQLIIEHVLPDKENREMNLTILYGTENNQSDLLSAISSMPLLAQTQVIAVRDFDKMKITDTDLLDKYLSKLPNSTFVILSAEEKGKSKVYKIIESYAQNIDCKPIPEYKVGSWMKNYCEQNSIPIESQALNFLVNLVGSNLLTLHQEILKVLSFKNDQSIITMDDIEETTGMSKDASVFALQKALANRQLNAALRILKQLLDAGQNISLIIAILFSFFRKLLIVLSLKQQGKNNDQIARLLHLSDYQFREISAAQSKFSLPQLHNVIVLLHELDVASKISAISDGSGLQMLCYKICRSK